MKKRVVSGGIRICLIAVSSLLLSRGAAALNSTVSTLASLSTAYSAAMPGDTISVADGTYDWGQINITNTNGSPSGAWIVIKPQNANSVTFTGSTYFHFQGTRVHVTGFRFANGNAGTNAVMAFRSSSSRLSNYCRISGITIDNYNTRSAGDAVENEWIAFYGIRNRLDHCTFINKCNAKATVVVWYSTANFPDKSVSTYHSIDSNYFRYRTFYGSNGGETIRVGVGNNSRTDGYNIIEYNLFEDCTQTDPEIISNKSANNTYRYNTFRNCNGGLTLRMGRYCRVYGNFFINNNATRTDSYGIRVIDKGHSVYNNYMEGLLGNNGNLTEMRSPIVVLSGNYPSSDSLNPNVLNGNYFSADSCTVVFNTIVNCSGGSGLNLGFTDGGANLYPPQGLLVANNAIKMSSGQAAYIDPINTGITYSASGNMYQAPAGAGLTNTSGFTATTLNYSTATNGILSAPSVLQDAAIGTTGFAVLLGNSDLQGQTRSSTYDVGADEINGSGNIIARPMDSTTAGAFISSIRSQYINFPAIPVKTYGNADFSPGAVASSSLPVSYSSSNTAVAVPVNSMIHIVGAGSCVITASQAGNANYLPAADVSQTLTVNKAGQSITFPSIGTKVWGTADFDPGAVASSGLPISYTSSNTSVVTIVNNRIHLVGIGSSTITANQSGSANYLAASPVNQSITVSKASQTITFPSIPSKEYGSPDFSPGATASSGLTVNYTSSKTSIATIVNGMIHIVGVGSCNITATQSGNAYYNAATNVVRSLSVTKASQTITFPPIPNKVLGSPDFLPGATASSGLTIRYTSSNTSVATIVSGRIHIVGVGTSNITASQSGNTYYNAAANVTQPFTVTAVARLSFDPSAETKKGSLFPNPCFDKFVFRFKLEQHAPVLLEVVSMGGKVVRNIRMSDLVAGEYSEEIETADLPGGIYILRFVHNDSVEIHRIVVSR